MRGKKSHFSLCRSLAASGWWLILCRNPSSPGFLGTPMNPMIPPPPPHSSIPSLLGGGVEDGCAGYQKQIIITIILIVTNSNIEREKEKERGRGRQQGYLSALKDRMNEERKFSIRFWILDSGIPQGDGWINP